MRAVLDAVVPRRRRCSATPRAGAWRSCTQPPIRSGRGPSCSSASSPNGSERRLPWAPTLEDRLKTVEQVERDWATGSTRPPTRRAKTAHSPNGTRATSGIARAPAPPPRSAHELADRHTRRCRRSRPRPWSSIARTTGTSRLTKDVGSRSRSQAAASSSCPVTRTFSTAATRSLSSPRSRSS